MSTVAKWIRGVRGRLLLISFVALFSLIAVIAIGYFTAKSLENSLHMAYDDRAPRLVLFGNLESGLNSTVALTYSAFATEDATIRAEALAAAKVAAEETKDYSKEFLKLKKSEKAQKICDEELGPHMDKFQKAIIDFLVMIKDIDKEPDIARKKISPLFTTVLYPEQKSLAKAIDDLQKNSTENNKAKKDEAYIDSEKAMDWELIIGAIFAGLNLTFVIYLANALARNLTRNSDGLHSNSVEIKTAVQTLEEMSSNLSSAVAEESAALTETASAIEEITATVAKTTETAKESAAISENSRQKAENGQQVVQEMLQSMSQITEANSSVLKTVTEGNTRIAEIVKLIQEIGKKTQVINDIVFQTKLLSFNASIEAARAGEAGKGFSVVAEEVGNLAMMSGTAAQEISKMLEGSVERVQIVVKETKEGVDRVLSQSKETIDNGSQVAKRVEQVLSELVADVAQVASMSLGISRAAEEQMRGVGEISKAITEIQVSNQANAKSATESSVAVSELERQVNLLNNTSQDLLVTVEGQSAEGRHQQVA